MNDPKKAKDALEQIRLKINQAMQAHRNNIKKLRADEREALRYYAKLTSKKMGIRYTVDELAQVAAMAKNGDSHEKIAFELSITIQRVRRMLWRIEVRERRKEFRDFDAHMDCSVFAES